jgi:hypothetical protein
MVGIVNGLLVAVTPTPRPPLRQLEAAKRASEEAVWHERWHCRRLSIGHQEPPGVAPGSLLEAFLTALLIATRFPLTRATQSQCGRHKMRVVRPAPLKPVLGIAEANHPRHGCWSLTTAAGILELGA